MYMMYTYRVYTYMFIYLYLDLCIYLWCVCLLAICTTIWLESSQCIVDLLSSNDVLEWVWKFSVFAEFLPYIIPGRFPLRLHMSSSIERTCLLIPKLNYTFAGAMWFSQQVFFIMASSSLVILCW